MSVTASYDPILYPGAGVAAPLVVTWSFTSPTDLVVTEIDDATTAETPRYLGVHFTVTQTDSGGTVTPVSALAVGKTWRIERSTPMTQPDQLRLGGSFSEHTVERMFDRQMRALQEVDSRVSSGDNLLRGDLERFYGPSLVADFGGIGNNAADNITAFTAAEASIYPRIYLPAGVYYTTQAASALTKHYYGPGTIRTSGGDLLPGRFTFITSRPDAGSGTGYTKFFSADLRAVNASYTVNSSPRTNLTESYYAPEVSQALSIYDNRSGYSGTTALLTVAASPGNTTITVNDPAGFVIGGAIGFNDGNDNITDSKTVSNIVGNVITLSSAIAGTYAIGYRVTKGKRTSSSLHHLELQHRGGGDAYINWMRVEISGASEAGQSHVFFTKTGGFDGGDIVFSASGGYATGREIAFDDAGNDVAVAGDVRTYIRGNGTGAREAFWIHDLALTGGSQPINAVWSFGGAANVGLDLARGDFSSNGDCAVGLKAGQRIFFDNTGSVAKLYETWGSVRGSRSIGYDSGAGAFTVKNGSTTTLSVSDSGVVNGSGMSGKYTPTLSNSVNVAASTAFECRWTRIGNIVSVSGQVQIDPTSTGTTILGLSLPIASNMSAGRHLSGVAASDEVAGMSARIFADATNDIAQIVFTAVDTANRSWGFMFTYEVI